MKIALLSEEPKNLQRVFSEELRERLASLGELYGPVLSKATLEEHKRFTRECEALFSTWGMAPLSAREIQTYFPNLRAVFYAAGTVQYFARPFLERGVEVFSAWQANAVPVAEFTFAQIVLAAKGYFQSAGRCKRGYWGAQRMAQRHPGNYRLRVGIVGVGSIGSRVCERLKTIDC